MNPGTRTRQILVAVLAGAIGTAFACRNERTQEVPPDEPTPTPTTEPGVAPTTTEPGEPGTEAMGEMGAADRQEAGRILTEIHQINAMEMEAGKLALTKARSEEVKDFANSIIEDHREADQKVVEFAQEHDITLSAGGAMAGEPSAAHLTAEAQSTLDRLNQAKPKQFESVFLTTMMEGHQRAVDKLQAAQSQVTNEDLRSLIGEVRSTVEGHLEKARELQEESGQAATPTSPRTQQGRRPQQNR